MGTAWRIPRARAPRVVAHPRGAGPLLVALVLACSAIASPSDATPRGPPVSASWTGVPLHRVAARISSLVGRPVVVDRRVDPDTPVTLDLRDRALAEALAEVCRATGTGCALLGETIRIVPEGRQGEVVAAERRRTAAIGRLPRPRRDLAGRRAPWAWPDGATPAALVVEAAAAAGLDLDGLDTLPHDHLRGADLPPLPLAARLDLILGQYGRQVDWAKARSDGKRVRAPVVEIAAGDADRTEVVAAAENAWEGFDAPGADTPVSATWSLEVAAPLDRLLATVADRMALDLDLDRDALRRRGVSAAEIVRLSVKDASRDELLDHITAPLGLAWRIEGRTLRVGVPAGN